MNKTTNIGIGIAIVALIMGGVAYFKTPAKILGSQGIQGPKGEQGIAGRDGKDGRDGTDGVTKIITETKSPTLGSVTGPDSFFPYYNTNNVVTAPNRVPFNTSTTTICTIKSPYATSTLISASVTFVVSSTTDSIIDFAQSTNTGATTTKIGSTQTVLANTSPTIVASTTATAGAVTTFAPNTFFVVNQKGGANNVFSPVGYCKAVFELN